VIGGRMGIKSFFDPRILTLSKQQDFAYNLLELVAAWVKDGPIWSEGVKEWTGTPTDLMAQFSVCQHLVPLLRDWTVPKLAKSLTTLARVAGSGVTFAEGSEERRFVFQRNQILKQENEAERTQTPAGA